MLSLLVKQCAAVETHLLIEFIGNVKKNKAIDMLFEAMIKNTCHLSTFHHIQNIYRVSVHRSSWIHNMGIDVDGLDSHLRLSVEFQRNTHKQFVIKSNPLK